MSESPLKLQIDTQSWDIVPLKSVSVFIKDGTHGTHERVHAGVPLLSAKNISPFGRIMIDEDDSLISEEEYHKIHSKYELSKGDLLLTVVGTLGRSALISSDKRFSIQRSIGVIRCSESNVKPEFLYQFTGTDYFQSQLILRSNATAQAGIYLGELAKIEVPCPPLPEQQKIAAILSSVDDVIEKTRAQIDKLKDLKTGMMQELLTKGIGADGKPHTEFKDSPVGRIPTSWRLQALGDIFDFKNGVNKDKTAFGHGLPIISYKNVYVGGGITDSDLSALVEMNDSELERFRVNYGDVFFTRTSETPDEIGFANVYLGNRDDVVFNGFVIRGRQRTQTFDSGFLKYAFQSNAVRKQMMDNSKFTTRAGISGESLGLIKITIPDISEQEAIASSLDSVHNRIKRAKDKLQSCQSLKKALMQDLLTGKVRVNVEDKEAAVG
ncbi:MAG: hypothetical protein GYB41_00790 [Oceanospirillales bacterium]|nr:hypothetical protein [Oceanospirillales bacterium]